MTIKMVEHTCYVDELDSVCECDENTRIVKQKEFSDSPIKKCITRLKELEELEILNHSKSKYSPIEQIEHLDKLPNLKKLKIVNSSIERIENLPESLEELELEDASIWLYDYSPPTEEEIKNMAERWRVKDVMKKKEDLEKTIDTFKRLKKLKKLTLKNSYINRLEELENLEELYIGNSKQIYHIPTIEPLIKLKRLIIKETKIEEIDGILNMDWLKEIELSNSKLRYIGGLPVGVEKLTLKKNQIQEINGLGVIKNLKYLNLSDNRITEIKNLDKHTNLEELDLSRSDINNFEIRRKFEKERENLKKEGWSKEAIDDHISIMADREYINYPAIKNISGLNNLTNLKKLSLHGQDITKISNLENLINLEYLDLGSNLIRKIQELDNLKKLRYLDLNGKNLRRINKKGTDSEDKRKRIEQIEGLESLENLEVLNLSRNRIEKIENLEQLKKLKNINLAENIMNAFQGLENLRDLEIIKLNDQNILSSDLKRKKIDLSRFKNLKEAYLTDNNIYKIDDIPQNVKILHVQRNAFTSISDIDPSKNLVNLRELNASNNKIKSLDGQEINHMKNLETLYLNNDRIRVNNALSNVKGLRLPKLIILKMNQHQLERIEGLDYLPMLDELMLNGRWRGEVKIKRIEGLDNLINLRVLSLNDFPIKRIEGIGKNRKLEVLSLEHENVIFPLLYRNNERHQEKEIELGYLKEKVFPTFEDGRNWIGELDENDLF